MQAHPSDVVFQRLGCGVLRHIALGDAACKQPVVACGGPAAVVAAMHAMQAQCKRRCPERKWANRTRSAPSEAALLGKIFFLLQRNITHTTPRAHSDPPFDPMATMTHIYICLMTFAAARLYYDGDLNTAPDVGNAITLLSYTSHALWLNMVAVGAHTVWTGVSVPWIYQLHVFLIIAIVPIMKLLYTSWFITRNDLPEVMVALSYAPIILLNLIALPLVLFWNTNAGPRACLTFETSTA